MNKSDPSKNIVKKRKDLSEFLIHLTRDETSAEAEAPGKKIEYAHDDYVQENPIIDKLTASDRLKKIIDQKKLLPIRATGSLQYKSSNSKTNPYIKTDWFRSICFTETPLDCLYQCIDVEKMDKAYKPYGLAFEVKIVHGLNGNPVFYYNEENDELNKCFNHIKEYYNEEQINNLKPILPLLQSYGPQYGNFRWLREWRVPGIFDFKEKVNAPIFGICPKDEISVFEGLIDIPFIDPFLKNLEEMKEKLRIKNILQD